MGNRKSFEVNYSIEGQGPDVLITFDHLGLSTVEIGKFWRAFCRIDKKNTGKVHRSEIYSYYRLKETPFLNLIFTSLSTKKNSDETLLSYLNFEEFVIIIWDFLSQEPALYAFNKFSKSKSDYLSFDTIRQMLSMILDTSLSSSSSLPPSPNLKKNLESILEEMDVGVGRNISSADFNSFIRENKSLISPLRRAQTQLRTQIIGEVYWKSVTDIRKIKLPGWTVLEIISRREDEIDANQVKITL